MSRNASTKNEVLTSSSHTYSKSHTPSSTNVEHLKQQQKSNTSHLTESLKATPEQMRLASILSLKLDAEVDTKIKQVLDIVPNVKSDYISIVLHDQDYDVQRTVDFILEHGHSEVEADWQTAGQKKKSADQSANDAVESNNRQTNNKTANKKGNRGPSNGQGFQQQSKQNKKHDAKYKEMNSKMESMSLTKQTQDKNEISGENGSNQNDSNEDQIHKAHNKRDGSFAKPQRNGRNFKTNRNENNKQRQDYQRNSFENNKSDSVENTNDATKENFANKVKSNGSDNLRDIGTWNTDQSNKRRSSNNRFNNRDKSNNKFNNSNNNTNANGNVEDWENEDEWQGDLTQTQIFTSSVQKRDQSKDSNGVEQSANTFTDKNNNNANTNVSSNQVNNTNDFPIGHFNAEEAAQNIKKAVGVIEACLNFIKKVFLLLINSLTLL